jgi:pimeloyl-ACP methyl ester carboxylesterase
MLSPLICRGTTKMRACPSTRAWFRRQSVAGTASCSLRNRLAVSRHPWWVPGQVPEIVFVNAMIPSPGETPGEWWDNTGWEDARKLAAAAGGYNAEFDLNEYFLHDVPPEVAAEGEPYQRPEANAVFASSCEFLEWPAVPIRVLSGEGDRFFPLEFQRRVARDRLGLEPDVLPGGHLLGLSNPAGVAGYLLRR